MSADQMDTLKLSGTESNSLRDYIASNHTTVLTVMFTDIKGYTDLAETQSETVVTQIRRAHDELLTGIIEKDHSGLVLKIIGDSLMSVFADPSSAVSKALEIQQAIPQFNNDNPNWEDIEVRIGMHMGQVTVEGEVTQDIFGRHVNRASRVEGLADGGQIYLSYTVFDSARGWLSHHEELGWQSHGYYRLKGIKEPIEIFEVWNKELRKPIAPLKAKPIKNRPKTYLLGAAVLAGAALALVLTQMKQTEVWLSAPYPKNLMLNQFESVQLDGAAEDKTRRIANTIEAGKHNLFYPTTGNSLQYTQVEIKAGENILKPSYREIRLPSTSLQQKASESGAVTSRSLDWQYQSLDAKGQPVPHEIKVTISMKSKRVDNQAQHAITWALTPKDAEKVSGQLTLKHNKGDKSKHEQQTLLTLDKHKFVLKTALINQVAQVKISGQFELSK